ncbi:hypothetical protein [Mycolicibacterium sphagni]|uniref:Uncharacterized protein n=1 Tax=Mycolicibacterium sphagni TaxID=1786 RepID=A0A255DMT4_9MYCO|nr:hypothetical protein [Mycolicibacterium sphagni]OYN79991.1 hypothetical protein CG716_11070 [Mycolicibacterium sphagni]
MSKGLAAPRVSFRADCYDIGLTVTALPLRRILSLLLCAVCIGSLLITLSFPRLCLMLVVVSTFLQIRMQSLGSQVLNTPQVTV